jgi:hypothetical protein
MAKLAGLGVSVIVAAVTLPPLCTVAMAASFDACIAGYDNVRTKSYEERFQQDAAAWALKCPPDWADKYRNESDDSGMMSDPCYGDPPICGETLGITPTYFECSGVAADKLGTPEQIAEADRIAKELQETKGQVCHFAQ